MLRLMLIFLGGGTGSVLRYLLSTGVARFTGWPFPTGTLLVNLLGCLAIGALAAILAPSAASLTTAR